MTTYSVVRQEEIRLAFDLQEADVVIFGTEPAYGHLRKVSNTGVAEIGAPALILSSQFEVVDAPALGRWNFFGPSKGLAPGKYAGDLWLVISGQKVLLSKFTLVVEPNITEIP